MTNGELLTKLDQAQSLLSDVYHWADTEAPGLLKVNAQIASLMSAADDCIWESIDILRNEE
jgi:hypothetical protein